MTLPLITPVGTNFLKDWPAQNAHNCDVFDAAAGPCLTSHPLGTYSPVWTASVTDPNLGTANFVRLGYYYVVFDMVYVYVEMRLGNVGALRGSGTYYISLPFNIAAGSPVFMGNGQAYSNATPASRQPLGVIAFGNSAVYFTTRMGSASRLVSELSPFTFNSLDGIMFCARYQRDMS